MNAATPRTLRTTVKIGKRARAVPLFPRRSTLSLAGAGVAVRGKGKNTMAHLEDVNADGLVDLVIHVETENLLPGELQSGTAVLTGETFGGVTIEGSDEIVVVPDV